MRLARQVLQGSLPELVASCTLMLLLEWRMHRCSGNRPGEAKKLARSHTVGCGRATATPERAWRGSRGLGGRGGSLHQLPPVEGSGGGMQG